MFNWSQIGLMWNRKLRHKIFFKRKMAKIANPTLNGSAQRVHRAWDCRMISSWGRRAPETSRNCRGWSTQKVHRAWGGRQFHGGAQSLRHLAVLLNGARRAWDCGNFIVGVHRAWDVPQFSWVERTKPETVANFHYGCAQHLRRSAVFASRVHRARDIPQLSGRSAQRLSASSWHGRPAPSVYRGQPCFCLAAKGA